MKATPEIIMTALQTGATVQAFNHNGVLYRISYAGADMVQVERDGKTFRPQRFYTLINFAKVVITY